VIGEPVLIYTKGSPVSTFHAQIIHAKDSQLMRNVTKFLITSTSIAVCCLGAASQAQAFNFTETADTGDGQLLKDVAVIGGTGGLSSQINGNISSNKDIDMFQFVLDVAGVVTFNATPDAGKNTPQLNINMYLLNEFEKKVGNVISNFKEDRDADPMSFSMKLNPGKYFLGIGSDDMDVLNAKGDLIAGNDAGVIDPKGIFGRFKLQNGDAKTGEIGESFGKYNIKIDTVANAAAVPTPALLPGLMALGAGVLRKRKAGVMSEELAEG
jgi:hypothetical protein